MTPPPRVLAIGGTDPTGGAGLAQDLITLAAARVHGTAVVTAVTVQGGDGVRSRGAVDPGAVRAQLEAVLDPVPAAIKTGMLPTAAIVEVVAELLPDGVPLVVDPVLAATSGEALADDDVLGAVLGLLLPRAAVVTPNADEARALTGVVVTDRAAQEQAARALVALGAQAGVVTGGHLPGPAVFDVFHLASGRTATAGSPRSGGGPVRGTGCRFASAIAALLARGEPVEEAIVRAHRATVWGVMRASEAGGVRFLGIPGHGGSAEGLAEEPRREGSVR